MNRFRGYDSSLLIFLLAPNATPARRIMTTPAIAAELTDSPVAGTAEALSIVNWRFTDTSYLKLTVRV
jgi:hypothetical protein